MANAPLHGVLLVGGASSRLGRDKARLEYRAAQPEWRRLAGLLEAVCDTVSLVHPDDRSFDYPAVIHDPKEGPLEAIAAAFAARPDHAQLVLACDLPLVDEAVLRLLVDGRNPAAPATCFPSPCGLFDEPLCTLYEPSFLPYLEQSRQEDGGRACPRTALRRGEPERLELPFPRALMNANDEADVREAEWILAGSPEAKTVRVRYFAQLAEEAGCEGEMLETNSLTAAGLYEQCRLTHGFGLLRRHVRAAVDGDFVAWESVPADGAEVAFLPPVAGG